MVPTFSPSLIRISDGGMESIAVAWRMQVVGNGPFFLGVLGSGYHGSCAQRHPQVWVTCGGNFGWTSFGHGAKKNVNNEVGEIYDYAFKSGDIVEMTFDPQSRLLTAKVEGKQAWSTARRLEGDGLGVVTPCVCLGGGNSKAILLSRTGASVQEFEVRNLGLLNNAQCPQRSPFLHPQHAHRVRKNGVGSSLQDLEADIRYTLNEDEKDERIQIECQFHKMIGECKSRVLERRIDLMMGLMADLNSEMNKLRSDMSDENLILRNEIHYLKQKNSQTSKQTETTAAQSEGYEVVEFFDD